MRHLHTHYINVPIFYLHFKKLSWTNFCCFSFDIQIQVPTTVSTETKEKIGGKRNEKKYNKKPSEYELCSKILDQNRKEDILYWDTHVCVCACVFFETWPGPFISSQLVNRLMHHHFKHYYVHNALWHLVMRVRACLHVCIRVSVRAFQFRPSEVCLLLLYSKYQLGSNKLP